MSLWKIKLGGKVVETGSDVIVTFKLGDGRILLCSVVCPGAGATVVESRVKIR